MKLLRLRLLYRASPRILRNALLAREGWLARRNGRGWQLIRARAECD